MSLTRSVAVTVLAATTLGVGCSEGDRADERDVVVLYSSVDGYVLRELIEAFETDTGAEVRVVGDTEATKTTGLVERLLTERDAPAAHVWWSSEPIGTIKLDREGLFAPFTPTAESAFENGWPPTLTNDTRTWHGFGQRARVIAFNADVLDEATAPTTLDELTRPAWRGRVGIAKPQFGTTRGHMGALLDRWGAERFEAWLTALRENGARVYDGNATVVRAVRNGEIDVGLTDTDDVWHAQRNGWPIGMTITPTSDAAPGSMLMPNTAALIARPDTPDAARTLLDWILSPRCEQVLAASDSRNVPIFPSVAADYPDLAIEAPWRPDFAAVADRTPEAMAIVDRVLGP